METQADFLIRLCKDVGCYSHKNNSPRHYSIKKYEIMGKKMGCLGWVIEKVKRDVFWINLPKDLVDKAKVLYSSKQIDDGRIYKEGILNVSFYVKRDSRGDDYERAVEALKAMKEVK